MTKDKYYRFDEYKDNICELYRRLLPFKEKIQLLGVLKGYYPLGVRLADALEVPLSVINFRERDSDSESVVKWVINNIDYNKEIVLVEDIFESENTYKSIMKFLNEEHHNKKLNVKNMTCYTLFSTKNIPGVVSLNKTSTSNAWLSD